MLLVSALLIAQVELGQVWDRPAMHIVALGDFGDGSKRQKAVAAAMMQSHRAAPFDFGLTLGDNFYRCGVRGVNDPLWKSRWEDLYPLGIPFYAALGNHDYGHPPVICPGAGSSPDAEIAYSAHSKSWRMPARYYSFQAGSALFIVTDTEGWSREQLAWIRKTLQRSADAPGIRWRIVIGHHPLFTSGTHLNERRIGALREQLFPVLEAAKVDLYIGGHDHDLEHLVKNGIHFVICGGGGAHLRKFRRRDPASVFQAVKNAFLDIRIDDDQAEVKFMDTALQTLETITLRKK